MPALCFIVPCTAQPHSSGMTSGTDDDHLAPMSEEASPPGLTAVPRLSSTVCQAEETGLDKG